MNSDVQRLPRYSRLPLIAREDKWDGGGMTYTTWYHLMYWYDMIWYDMIPDNVIWCQWIMCCTIWCSLVFIYLLVFDIHIDYLTWPYYHLINEYRLKKCTADFVTGSWSISRLLSLIPTTVMVVLLLGLWLLLGCDNSINVVEVKG